MNRARYLVKVSTLLISLALFFGATENALAANYPPVPAVIIVKAPPLVKGNVVVVPKAPESKEVFTLILVPSTQANLANLTDQAKPKPVLVTAHVVMGGVGASSTVPKVLINTKTKAPAEIQTAVGIPSTISLSGYKPGQKVVITATEGGKVVVIGTFTAGKGGTLVLPAVTLIGNSSVKFSMKSSGGTKSVIVRSVASKSKVSTAKVKIAKKK